MPKRKEQRFTDTHRPIRKSDYSADRECFMDENGNYTYCQWVRKDNGNWELQPVCTAVIGEGGVTSDITIFLDDLDCEEDRSNDRMNHLRDRVADRQLASYSTDQLDESGDRKQDPWDRISYETPHKDVFDEAFPEEKTQDPLMQKLLELMDELTEDQRNLIYAHLGENKYFEQIAQEESIRKGHPVSRQAISNRWDKILARLCKGFGVEKPRRRKGND